MKNKERLLGMGAALVANVIFGFSFIFSKLALTAAHPLIILSMRFTVAFLVMCILVLSRAVRVDFRNKPRLKLILMCLAQPFAYFILELYGLSMVSSALSGVITSLVPVGVFLYSMFFTGEKPTALQGLCLALSVGGVAAISAFSGANGENRLLGILLLIGAVISASAYNLLSRGASVHYSPIERTFVMFLIGAVGFNLITLGVLRERFLPLWGEALSNPDFYLAIAYLAILSSVGAFLLYNYATGHISAVSASSFSSVITVVSVFAGLFILHESFSLSDTLLCLSIVLGVFGVNYAEGKKAELLTNKKSNS